MQDCIQLLLVAYIASLKMFRDRSASRHGQRKSLDGWDKALKFAEEALEKSQDAKALRQVNWTVNADATTETAFKTLKLRYNFVNKFYWPINSTDAVPIAEDYINPPLINNWSDKVAKVLALWF